MRKIAVFPITLGNYRKKMISGLIIKRGPILNANTVNLFKCLEKYHNKEFFNHFNFKKT